MIIFLDTEFTGLDEPYLLSAGLVSADGRELYFELEGTSPEICSPFVIQNVLPLMDGPKLSPSEIAKNIAVFICSCATPNIILFCDAPRYDIELLKPFLPPKLYWNVAVPSFETEAEEVMYRSGQENAFTGGLRRHHALDDARAMRCAWLAVCPDLN